MLFRWAGSLAYHVRIRASDPSSPPTRRGCSADRLTTHWWRPRRRRRSAATPATGSTRSMSSIGLDDRIDAAFAWDGIEHLADPVAAGTGVIAVLPHMGNWDARRVGRWPSAACRWFRWPSDLRPGAAVPAVPASIGRRYGMSDRRSTGTVGVGKALTSALADGKRDRAGRRPRPHRPRRRGRDVRRAAAAARRPGAARDVERRPDRGRRRHLRDAGRLAASCIRLAADDAASPPATVARTRRRSRG